MNSESQSTHLIDVVALVLCLSLFVVILISLLATHPTVAYGRFIALVHFLLSNGASQFVTDLPFVRWYAELWPVYAVFVVLLATIAYYEFKLQIIPDLVTLPGIGIGVGLAVGFGSISLINSLLGVVIAFGGLSALNAYWLRTRGRVGIGLGDIKMQAMIGAFLGLPNAIIALGLASMLTTIYVAAFRRNPSPVNIEFGSSLAVAAFFVALVPVSLFL